MTYTDKDLELIPTGTDCSTGPFYSTSSISLTVSPDIGTGEDIVAMLNIETFTDGGSFTDMTVEIVTSEVTGLTTTPRVVGSSGAILSTDMELIDDAGRVTYQPIIVRINPNHWGALNVSGTDDSFIGLRLVYGGANPGTLTVNAQFVVGWASSPAVGHHASGFKIL